MENNLKMPVSYTEMSNEEMLDTQGGDVTLAMSADVVNALRSNKLIRSIAGEIVAKYVCTKLNVNMKTVVGINLFNAIKNAVPSMIATPGAHSKRFKSVINGTVRIGFEHKVLLGI